VAEVARAIDELGLEGVMLHSNVDGVYVGDAAFEPRLAELDRRGAYVQLHPADPPTAPLPELPRWLMEFPFDTTRWHLPHCGGTVPFLAARLATLARRDPELARLTNGDPLPLLGRFYVDTAQADNEAALAATRAVIDIDRIVLGTVWPYAVLADGDDPQPALDRLLGPELRARVDRSNALRLAPSLHIRLRDEREVRRPEGYTRRT
jgi:hypothetical protein